MRSIRVMWILTALFVLASSAVAGLRDDVERLVRTAPLKGGSVAVSIRDCNSGTALVSINPALPMTPASNMKLITSGAALHALGADFEFSTRLVRDGERLIVLGDGDPAFGDPELLAEMAIGGRTGMDVESFLDLWVKPVGLAGLRQVSEVVVDARIFDGDFVHPNWPADQLNNRYCAQVSGLNFHANVLHFFPRPRPGEPPLIVDCRPQAPWLKLTNAASSRGTPKDRNDAWIARKAGTNELTFRGNVRFAYKTPVPVTVHDMPEFFAQALADRLARSGIAVGACRSSRKGDPIWNGVAIGPAVTTPIATVIGRCNTESENLYAECLLKRLGHALTGEPGSWTNGTALVRHIVHQRLGDPSLLSGVIISDGSGLSAENRITAGMMTAWLNSFHNDQRLGPVFIESLAVAGHSGTLENRMGSLKTTGAVVQAKTGFINNVSCLSGYVTMPDGRRRCFSILANNLKGGTVPAAKKLQDQIVTAVAEDMAVAPVQLGSD